ncbi:hypothetical protein GUJ93_ZPchr0004g39789 [Zizania palustris]|uniref:Uncharacterized protein n=1 Tax=Zizania palustris TaxID=103762 RepID=A0A8J5SZ24_ZIZPA|nr:hypothetical protein GUJ93_ZPchr0004g39789 [Zizania palustris]
MRSPSSRSEDGGGEHLVLGSRLSLHHRRMRLLPKEPSTSSLLKAVAICGGSMGYDRGHGAATEEAWAGRVAASKGPRVAPMASEGDDDVFEGRRWRGAQQVVANLRAYLGLAPVASTLPSFPHDAMGSLSAPSPPSPHVEVERKDREVLNPIPIKEAVDQQSEVALMEPSTDDATLMANKRAMEQVALVAPSLVAEAEAHLPKEPSTSSLLKAVGHLWWLDGLRQGATGW